MSKQDRQGVRTPADIERKYNLGALSKGGGDSGQLSQINQALSQFMADTNAKIANCVTKEEMDVSVGQKTDDGGEIFNDYENNKAISEYSTAKGTSYINSETNQVFNSIAGQKAFEIIGFRQGNDIGNRFILNNTEGLAVDDIFSVMAVYDEVDIGTIVAIDTTLQEVQISRFDGNDNKINPEKLNSYFEMNDEGVFQNNYLFVRAKPSIGTTDIGKASYVEGFGNHAVSQAAHAEGIRTIAMDECHAEGADTKAINSTAHAEGKLTVASGKSSHAEGFNTQATAAQAHSEGRDTIASGVYGSHAEGYGSKAAGNYSHAEGKGTEAQRSGSHAEGYKTKAIGENSHAEGQETEAHSTNSHAEGRATVTNGYYSHAEGLNTQTLGRASHAEGYSHSKAPEDITTETTTTTIISTYESLDSSKKFTLTKGWGAHAEGLDTLALSNGAHSEGGNTIASGDYSHTEGYKTVAAGHQSHAEGGQTKTEGENSHAEGYKTKAIGNNSHTEGQGTEAHASSSHAEGYYTVTKGDYSHTEGIRTHTFGKAAHAEGYSYSNIPEEITSETDINTIITTWEALDTNKKFILAKGQGSHAEGIETLSLASATHSEGINTIASANSAHAEGHKTKASGDYSHAEGSGTRAQGKYSHAEGEASEALGEVAHVEGRKTKATGKYSHAEGQLTTAEGYGSHAEGDRTKTNGYYSHAEGYLTEALGEAAHAEGRSTDAIGNHSHAEGFATQALGNCSHSSGYRTMATRDNQFVAGGWNKENNEALFIIGNGTDGDNRNNAFEVLADGSATVQAQGVSDNSVVVMSTLNTKINKSTPRLINKITLSEDADLISVDLDSDGKSFSLQTLYITFEVLPEFADTTTTRKLLLCVRTDNYERHLCRCPITFNVGYVRTFGVIKSEAIGGITASEVISYTLKEGAVTNGQNNIAPVCALCNTIASPIKEANFYLYDSAVGKRATLKVGSKIEIWGCDCEDLS